MSKVYTKRGDMGETDLIGGVRTTKADLRVDCYGTMDETNAQIGMAYALLDQEDIKSVLRQIQVRLFAMGTELATADMGKSNQKNRISGGDVEFLEQTIDSYQEKLTPRNEFLVPGGTPASAALHVARTVARRFERELIRLNADNPVSPVMLKYQIPCLSLPGQKKKTG